jgi:hypothetical protein
VIAVVVLGSLAGLGVVGLVLGLRSTPVTLDGVAATLHRPVDGVSTSGEPVSLDRRAGRLVNGWIVRSPLAGTEGWGGLAPSLNITGQSYEWLVSRMLLAGGAGLLVPLVAWIVAAPAGVGLPLGVAVVLAVIAAPAGAVLPVVSLLSQARGRRRHVRVVTGTFVDLVVLSLAGGVGIEGALLAASQVSADWAARRMARALSRARDSGQSPWAALGQLGEEIGVPELVELSSTVQLAGTEGARIRQSLAARAVSFRRHEQADAESEANAVTERLFLPGALLLVGFLLFVGYPAFSRILGGL